MLTCIDNLISKMHPDILLGQTRYLAGRTETLAAAFLHGRVPSSAVVAVDEALICAICNSMYRATFYLQIHSWRWVELLAT